MESLFGLRQSDGSELSAATSSWENASDSFVSVRQIWQIFSPVDIDPVIHKYSGGCDGRLIARHERVFGLSGFRVVTLHDHKFNEVFSCTINEKCTDIFIYVCKDDSLRVVTTNGKLITFVGNRQISKQEIGVGSDILSAAFWDNGLVYLDKANNIVEVPFFKEPKIMCTNVMIGIPMCFDVIPPAYTANGSPYVLLSDADGNLHVFSYDVAFETKMESPIITFTFSPTYDFICFLVEPLTVIITPITLDELIFRMDIDDGNNLEQVVWIGKDAPLIVFDDIALIILSTCETVKIQNDGKSVAFSSLDSALLLSSSSLKHIFFPGEALSRCVSSPMEGENDDVDPSDIQNPSVYLIDAFLGCKPSNIIKMKNNPNLILKDAIKDCVEAAIQCDDINFQKILMMSACFGRSYLDSGAIAAYADEFKNATRSIRLSNAFRTQLNIIVDSAIFVDGSEVQSDDIVSRFCLRGLYSAAYDLADTLGCDKANVVTKWCANIISSMSEDNDEEVVLEAFKELKEKGHFDSAKIATIAYEYGRKKLANKIAAYEKDRALVIPFYMSSGMWDNALSAAANSCDSNIFIDVLRKALDERGEDDVIAAIGYDRFSYASISKFAYCGSADRDNILSKCLEKVPINHSNLEMFFRKGLKSYTNQMYNKMFETKQTDLPVEDIAKEKEKKKKKDNKKEKSANNVSNNEPTESLTSAIEIGLIKLEKMKLTKNKIKKISVNFPNHNWIINQLEAQKFEKRLLKFQIKISNEFNDQKYINLTFNETLRYAADQHTLSRVLEIAKDLKHEIPVKKVISVVGSYLAKTQRFDDFLIVFLDDVFKTCYFTSALIASQYFTPEQTQTFISKIPDPKQQTLIKEMIKDNEFVDTIYGSKNINCNLFKASVIQSLLG